eukprot:5063407-Pleurochrysis_carterae.AAC.1
MHRAELRGAAAAARRRVFQCSMAMAMLPIYQQSSRLVAQCRFFSFCTSRAAQSRRDAVRQCCACASTEKCC